MEYKDLPEIGKTTLPDLHWEPTRACGPRESGSHIQIAFAHRWGISNPNAESIAGVINEFMNPANQASAHIVYAGEVGPSRGQAVQMVPLSAKAWTEAADNSKGVSVEFGDEIWLGGDPEGFARAARIFGWLCHHCSLPPNWVRNPHGSTAKGISRHADGGAADGGHTQCPTTDIQLWEQFVYRVKAEYKHGGYRKEWAR